jgi:hypothetical protein
MLHFRQPSLLLFVQLFHIFNHVKKTHHHSSLANTMRIFTCVIVDMCTRLANTHRPEAVFLFVCDPSMNELWVTYTHRDICIGLSRLLTARS